MPGPAAPRIPICAAGVPIFRNPPPSWPGGCGPVFCVTAPDAGKRWPARGEPVDHLIIVATGQLKAVRTSHSGREQVVRTLEPGDFVGELALFSPARHENDLVAVTDNDLCLVPRMACSRFCAGIRRSPWRWWKPSPSVSAAAERLIADLALLDVGQRLGGVTVANGGVRIRRPGCPRTAGAHDGATHHSLGGTG